MNFYLSRTASGLFFRIQAGTLTLDENVTLDGGNILNGNQSLIEATYNGVLIMKPGSKITGGNNTSRTYGGGALYASGGQ